MRSSAIAVVLSAIAATAVFSGVSSTSAQNDEPSTTATIQQPVSSKPKKEKCLVKQAVFFRYARKVYRRDKIRLKALRRLDRMRACAHTKKANRKMLRYQRRQGEKRKERIILDALTPFGDWAIPGYIVMCESGGNFRAKNPSSTAGGAYQIIDDTWYAYGGSRYDVRHPAAAAPPIEQHEIAGRIWRGSGAGAWLCS